jgi:predicted AlkP superfamily phosphohydrolase/phosphomutase
VEGTIPWERAHFDRFLAHSKHFAPDLVAFYTHFGDGINHLNWKSAAHGDGFLISGVSKPALGPARAITKGMRFIDTLLGEYMRVLPRDATLVVVSDHGFDFRGYEHDNSPAGVMIVRGSEIRPGVFTGASLYDVAPTLLQLLGIPAAHDMDGAPLSIGREGAAFNRELARVSTYGSAAEPLEMGQTNEEKLKEHEEYLRALGYVN